MNEYSQGVMGDGAAILRNGARMSVDEIVSTLNALEAELARYEGAEVVAYACHGAGCDVNEDCELISADEAADYEPECVTPLIIKPAKEG